MCGSLEAGSKSFGNLILSSIHAYYNTEEKKIHTYIDLLYILNVSKNIKELFFSFFIIISEKKRSLQREREPSSLSI